MSFSPVIFNGTSHPFLAQEVAALLATPLGKRDLHFFPDKEISVEILENVWGRHAFLLQSLGSDPNIHLMELFVLLDALKRASAASLIVVLPYFPYARQDRMVRPGFPITAKLIANLLTRAGADYLITMDLHSEQIEGFFDIPVKHLLSRTLLIPYCASLNLNDLVVVAPDKGGIKIASKYAKQLEAPLALVEKERLDPSNVEMRLFVGDVKDKTVLITDDMCSTAGTLVNAAQVCAKMGAKRIIAVVGHGLFTHDAIKKIERSPIEKVITTNTIPMDKNIVNHPKIKIISIAPLLAEAIGQLSYFET